METKIIKRLKYSLFTAKYIYNHFDQINGKRATCVGVTIRGSEKFIQ